MRADADAVDSFLRPGPARAASARPGLIRAVLRAAGLALGLGLAACATPQQPGGGGAAAIPQPARTAPGASGAGGVTVALLAPFSGRESAMQAQARDLEAAARMALAGAPGLTLKTYDTAADPARAAQAADQAAADGAAVILGPFYAQEAQAVAPVAQRTGVPALAFTPFSGAATPHVAVLGYAPENEVARILGYAASQGLTRVALVHPQTQYGDLAAAAVAAAAPRAGVTLTGVLSYPRSFEGVQTAIAAGARGLLDGGPQAVLIADGGQALESVGAFLAYHDVSPRALRFLGLAQWAEGAPQRADALGGGWFASVDPARRADFEARFTASSGRRPVPVAGLGYDAALAARALAEGGRGFARAAQASAPEMAGAAGPFRIGSDGVVRRGLAVFEVRSDGPAVIDPAPAALAPGA